RKPPSGIQPDAAPPTMRCHQRPPSGPRTNTAVPVPSETAAGFDVTVPPIDTIGWEVPPAMRCQLRELLELRPNTSIRPTTPTRARGVALTSAESVLPIAFCAVTL